jgi:hypothetical protein
MARGFADWGRVTGGPNAVGELPTYVIALTSQVLGSSPGMLNMLNPAGSKHLVKVRDMIYSSGSGVAFAGNALGLPFVERIIALGTGTIITPQPFDSGDPPSVVTAKEVITVNPGLGVRLGSWFTESMVSNVAGDHAYAMAGAVFNPYSHKAGQATKPLTLLQGEGLSVRDSGGSGNLFGLLMIVYTEEPV